MNPVSQTNRTQPEPLVSVYLPTKDRPSLLREAAESVLRQTVTDLELLIIDDGSDEATGAVIKDLRERDIRIRAFRFDDSRGAPAARNLAIANAHGQFLTGIDDDDLMLPNRLESLLQASPSDWSLVCSSFFLERNGRTRQLNRRARVIQLDDILHQNLIGNQAMLLTQRARDVGGFDDTFVASQDYDFWTRLIERHGPARRISTATYIMRESAAPTGITRSTRFGDGARQYTAKHGPKMTRTQLRSQRLIHKITSRQKLQLRDVMSSLTWATLPLFVKYWGSTQPILRWLLRR